MKVSLFECDIVLTSVVASSRQREGAIIIIILTN